HTGPRDRPSVPTRRSSDLAECDGHAREEEPGRGILLWNFACPGLDGRGPHFPREIGEIADADPFDDDKCEVKCLRHHGQSEHGEDRKSTRLNSSHVKISYA